MRREDGQGTLEYIGVVLLVAIVIAAAAALLVATGLGERIVGAFKRGLCVVAGQACDPPKTPCVTASDTHAEHGELDLLVVRIGENLTEVRERFADGSIGYTLVNDNDAGFIARVGAGVHIRWGAKTYAYGEELKFAVLAGMTEGRTWIRKDLKQAATVALQAGVSDVFGGHPPAPDITFSELRGDASLSLAISSALSLDLGAAQAYGESFDHGTGERTVYIRNNGNASATLLLPQASRADGDVQGEERYAVTYGRDGTAKDLAVLTAVDVSGSATLPPHLAALAGRLGVPLDGGRHVETEQHLDLTKPDNAEIASRFLGADPGGADIALAAGLLRDRIDQEGGATVRSYRTEADVKEIGGHLMGVGGTMGEEDSSALLDKAVSRGADGVWVDDPMCAKA